MTSSRSFTSNYSNKKSFRSVRKSKSSKDVLSEISSPKFRWKQNATIKEAAGEAAEARKVEVKLKKEDKEKNGEVVEELERVATPDQVRSRFFPAWVEILDAIILVSEEVIVALHSLLRSASCYQRRRSLFPETKKKFVLLFV